MRDFVGNLTSGLEEAIVKVNESQERAQSLSEQAQFLEKCVAQLQYNVLLCIISQINSLYKKKIFLQIQNEDKMLINGIFH